MAQMDEENTRTHTHTQGIQMVAASICSLVFPSSCHIHCHVNISANDQECNSLQQFLSLNTYQGLLYIPINLTKKVDYTSIDPE